MIRKLLAVLSVFKRAYLPQWTRGDRRPRPAIAAFFRRIRIRHYERVATRLDQRVICGDCGPQSSSRFDVCPACGGRAEPIANDAFAERRLMHDLRQKVKKRKEVCA
jgi:hypothetical protein